MLHMKDSLLIINEQMKISYQLFKGNQIGIIFLNGFMSNKTNTKCIYIEEYCRKNNINFICFDYYGHGESTGPPYDVTIGKCIESTLHVIDHLTEGPQLLVASSMGGWIMNLVALKRRTKIAGMIGIANATDFTKCSMWDVFPREIQDKITLDKVWESPEFPITYQLIKEAKQHFILHRKLDFEFPVILLHGDQDLRVPHEYSRQLFNCYNNANAELKIIAGANHGFYRPTDMLEITNCINKLRTN